MTGKEYNNLPEIKEPKWYGLTKKQWIIVSLIFLGILLNIIAVLTVYYGFGRNKVSPKSIDFVIDIPTGKSTPLQREAEPYADQIEGRSANPEVTICPITTDTCPVQEKCTVDGTTKPPCTPIPESAPCPCQCQCTKCPEKPAILNPMSVRDMAYQRPFDLLRGEPKDTTALKESVKYPLRSYERLQVAMDLMKNFYEPYYQMFTRRSCGLDADERRICPMCRNRYNYLNCIYDYYLVGQGDKDKQNLVPPQGQGSDQLDFNRHALKSSLENKWAVMTGLLNKVPDDRYLQPGDYNKANFLANRNAMTMIYHVPGRNQTDYPRCIPCNTNIQRHAECLVERGANKPNWNWQVGIQYAP